MPEASGLKLLGVPEIASTREAGVIMRRDGFLTPAAHAIVEELRHICAREPTN
jgi:LysR family transcriptional regulator of gallate degradation